MRRDFLHFRLGFRHDARLALGLAEFGQFQTGAIACIQALVGADQIVEMVAFAQQGLRFGRVIPEIRVTCKRVQFVAAEKGAIPVKDTSSAAPATARCVWTG
jgi:hypothetical protein